MSGSTVPISGTSFTHPFQVDPPQAEQGLSIDNYPGYPRTRIVFSCDGGWDDIWKGKLFNKWDSTCRMMEFKSSEYLSGLDRFALLGCRNGQVSLILHFSTKKTGYYNDAFLNYFTAKGFTNDC